MSLTSKKPGLMLLDLLIFVCLAGLFYLSISKMIPKRRVGQNIDDFFIGLNDLSSLAIQEAYFRQLPAKLEFKQSNKTGSIKLKALIMDKFDEKGHPIFKEIENGFIKSSTELPRNINLVRWWTDTQKKESSDKKFEINVSRDGIPQIAILHLSTTLDDQKFDFSAVGDPFLGTFRKESSFKEIPKPDTDKDEQI